MPKHVATTLGLSTPLPSKPSAPAPWSQLYTLPADPSRLHFKGGLAKNADGHRQHAVPASESTQPPPAKFVARITRHSDWRVRVFSRHDVTNCCSVASVSRRIRVAAFFSFGGRWGRPPRCPVFPAESDGHGCGSFLAPFNPKIRLDEIW